MNKLIITSGSGRAYIYDFDNDLISIIFETENDNEYLMGVTRYEDEIIISSNYSMYFLKEESNLWGCVRGVIEEKANPLFGHIKNIGGYLFIPLQSSNIVSIFDISTHKNIGVINIKANHIQTNFDNLVDVEYYNNNFYITCNSYYEEDSCVITLDKNLDYVDKLVYGWGLYNFGYLDDKYCGLCNHIYETDRFPCLIVGNQIKVKTPNYYKLFGLAANDDFIFVVGGAITPHENTTISGGLILVIDRKTYKIERVKILQGLGKFMGCLLLEKDLINDRQKELIDLSHIIFGSEGQKKIQVL